MDEHSGRCRRLGPAEGRRPSAPRGLGARNALLTDRPIRGENLTKMFHVKHFRPIEAKNLTSAHTPGGLDSSGIARKIDTLSDRDGRERARRKSASAGGRGN